MYTTTLISSSSFMISLAVNTFCGKVVIIVYRFSRTTLNTLVVTQSSSRDELYESAQKESLKNDTLSRTTPTDKSCIKQN